MPIVSRLGKRQTLLSSASNINIPSTFLLSQGLSIQQSSNKNTTNLQSIHQDFSINQPSKQSIKMSSNDGSNSSTLQSYVDSAVGTAQNVLSSITGNPADKVKPPPLPLHPRTSLLTEYKIKSRPKQTPANPKPSKNTKTPTPPPAWAPSPQTPIPAPPSATTRTAPLDPGTRPSAPPRSPLAT